MKINAIIYPQDLADITGKNIHTCYKEYKKIRKDLNLKKHEYLSLTAFCEHVKINRQDAILALTTKNKA